MHTLRNMVIPAKVEEVLKRLKVNRAQHKKIVLEAREGYHKEVRRVLQLRLAEAKGGKHITLIFDLQEPQDHTHAYDTIITMMELTTQSTIELTADQVRHFINDDWDWKDHFLEANSTYSLSAMEEVRGMS